MIDLERGTPAWDHAWGRVRVALAAEGLNAALDAGEGWQYMGTGDMGRGMVHTFRNRALFCGQDRGERRVSVHVPLDGGPERVLIQPEVPPGGFPLVVPPKVTAYTACGGKGWRRQPGRAAPEYVEGRDWICTGTYDAMGQCGSDADSGL